MPLSPSEAADEIGCTTSYLRSLIRSEQIKATKVPSQDNRHGYVYRITKAEVNRFKKIPVSGQGQRGVPRPLRKKVKL